VKLARDARDIAAAFREGRTPAFDAEEGGAWINAADWLIENGELKAAQAALRTLNAAMPGLEWAANLCGLFERAPPAEPGMPDFRDDLLKDVQVMARPGAETALILFCGARHRVGMHLPLIHRWLARAGASLVYLRDFHGLCYLKGVASLGEGLEATTAALRRTLDTLGAKRTVCFGCSGGGYGALRYALELGGDAISLGSPVNMEPDFNAHMNHGAVARQLKAAFPDQDLDLRRRIEAAPRRPRSLIVYGERNWNERIHAEHMAGLKDTALYPVTGYSGHATAPELIRRGEFEPMLQGFLAARPGGSDRPPGP
jgi:hypothetical protein